MKIILSTVLVLMASTTVFNTDPDKVGIAEKRAALLKADAKDCPVCCQCSSGFYGEVHTIDALELEYHMILQDIRGTL